MTSLAEDTCTVKTPKGTAVDSRTRILKTTDGKTMTIIGQNHGDRLDLRSIMDIVNYKSDNNELWLWNLEAVLKANKQAIKDASEEVTYLSELLKNNPEIKHIGFEMAPETVSDHLKYSEKFRDDFLNETIRRKIDNMSSTPYVLGFSGSTVFLKMTEPGLFKKRIFFGVESLEASNLHHEKLLKYDLTLTELKNKIEISTLEGQDFLQKIRETGGELLQIYNVYTPELDEKIMTAALGKSPDKYKKLVSNWISSSLEEMKAMKKRDEKIAESIHSLDGSTVVTLGQAHLESVMSMLVKKCKNESPTKSKSPVEKSKAVTR